MAATKTFQVCADEICIAVRLRSGEYLQFPCPFALILGSREPHSLTVDIEGHVPKPDLVHDLLRQFEVAIPSEDRIDKSSACFSAHRLCVSLGGLQHVVFAPFEELLQLFS